MTDERHAAIPQGAMLYDPARLETPSAAVFTREHWAAAGRLREMQGGRGSVAFVQAPAGEWVLRHYRRGGLAARISTDRYLWLGADRTRSFREWRLLAELRRRDLPVPAPVAARFVRSGPTYRADLITERIPAACTLAEEARAPALHPERWHAVGRTIARFHAHGVCHADLNAHNILLADGGAGPAVYVLDFDRGRFRARGSWEQAVLARLCRSVEKVTAGRLRADSAPWQALLEGYAAVTGAAAPPPRGDSNQDNPPSIP